MSTQQIQAKLEELSKIKGQLVSAPYYSYSTAPAQQIFGSAHHSISPQEMVHDSEVQMIPVQEIHYQGRVHTGRTHAPVFDEDDNGTRPLLTGKQQQLYRRGHQGDIEV